MLTAEFRKKKIGSCEFYRACIAICSVLVLCLGIKNLLIASAHSVFYLVSGVIMYGAASYAESCSAKNLSNIGITFVLVIGTFSTVVCELMYASDVVRIDGFGVLVACIIALMVFCCSLVEQLFFSVTAVIVFAANGLLFQGQTENVLSYMLYLYGTTIVCAFLGQSFRERAFGGGDKKRHTGQVACDRVTGLPNRQYFTDEFVRAQYSAIRNRQRLAICLIEVDKPNSINEKYGNTIGNLVLLTLAKMLIKMTRRREILSRWRGMRFILLLRTESDDVVLELAEPLRQLVGNSAIDIGKGQLLKVTVRVGTAVSSRNEDLSWLVNRAYSELSASHLA